MLRKKPLCRSSRPKATTSRHPPSHAPQDRFLIERRDLQLIVPALLLLVAGVTLRVVGTGASLWAVAEGLRWLAVLLLSVFAWRRRSVTPWIFVAMVAGTELGIDAPAFAISLRVFSDIFLRLIKTIVAPLILATLITGIAGHGDLKSVGRMGIKSLIYFEVVTTLALGIGLIAINISKAGVGLHLPATALAQPVAAAAPLRTGTTSCCTSSRRTSRSPSPKARSFRSRSSLSSSASRSRPMSEAKRAPVVRLTESLSEVMFRFTNVVMYFAPLGVGAAMAFTVGHMGAGVLVNLGKLLLTFYAALVAFAVLVLLPAALLFRVPVKRFLAAVAEPATIAFATSTSEAALPRAMEAMEALGVPRRIVAFVIPAGYSFNLDGSTLYLASPASSSCRRPVCT